MGGGPGPPVHRDPGAAHARDVEEMSFSAAGRPTNALHADQSSQGGHGTACWMKNLPFSFTSETAVA